MPATSPLPLHQRWLTLGEASRLLGVDASTLRAWADAGRIKAFRTPGGHRRFVRADLRALVEGGRRPRSPEVARLIYRHGSALARTRSPAAEAWYAALDVRTRARIRGTCRSLMRALAGYLSGGVERRAHLKAAQHSGRVLGRVLAARGLSPMQATRAFLHFRDLITEAVTTKLSIPPADQVRSLRQVNAFLNQVMVRMMEVFEQGRRSA